MKQRYSYKECYHILDVKPNCNWTELRKSYKLKIQKWHPDRYDDNTPQKDAANDKIKNISIAYKQLQNYYNKHSSLPEIEQANFRSTAAPKHYNAHKPTSSIPLHPTPSHHFRWTRTAFLILTIGGISYSLLRTPLTINSNNLHQTRTPTTKTNVNLQSSPTLGIKKNTIPPLTQSSTIRSASPSTKYSVNANTQALSQNKLFFTYGSSIGHVVGIQGVPDKIKNDVWFYGESKVYFIDGKVNKWERAQGSPLKAIAILENH